MAKEIDLQARQRRLAWFLILPAVVVVVLVIGYPLIQVIVYSFLKYKLDVVTPPELHRAEQLRVHLHRPSLLGRGESHPDLQLLFGHPRNGAWAGHRHGGQFKI